MHTREYVELLALQSGVVSRRQLIALGCRAHDLQRMVRRRDLVRVHPGVFVDHTGELTWLQRAWVGVLAAWPAALSHDSAIRAADGPGRVGRDDTVIHLAVHRDRAPSVPPGCRLHRVAELESRTLWTASPPRVRIEEALVDVAAGKARDFDAIAALADAVQARRTTPARIRAALADRSRVRRRDLLSRVLADLELGTCSVLEHGYLTLVERPHGLPLGRRQVRASLNGPVYRDVVYGDCEQIVELDGRLWHDTPRQRDRDLDRDLDAAASGQSTVRLGWGQVFDRPCATAARVGRLLAARGWTGSVRSCPQCPDHPLLAG